MTDDQRQPPPAGAPSAPGEPTRQPIRAEPLRPLQTYSDRTQTAATPQPVKKPKRERVDRPLVRSLSVAMTFITVIGLAALIATAWVRSRFDEPGPLGTDKAVMVRGSATTVAEQLSREGVIDENSTLFALVAEMYRGSEPLKAGEYLFPRQASLRQVLDIVKSGKAIEYAVAIPEGLTSEQIVQRLGEHDFLSGEVRQIPREGSLLPATYKVSRGHTRDRILQQMAEEQTKALNQIWARRPPNLPLKTPQELVTLASIVEKETGKADERPRVAGVFVNRLNQGMKLQSDPTIVYGLVGGKGTLGRPILRSEIDRPTPYNTYSITGLPPGPIANPGRAAMEAVVNHVRSRELFFVADGTGGHAFAETLEQHNRNVQRWRQIERERGAAPADTGAAQPAVGAPAGAPPSVAAPGNRRSQPAVPPRANAFAGAPGAVAPPTADLGAPPAAPVDPNAPRPRAFDASAGTPRDPLLNRSYDLNSPKTVPALR